MRNGLKFDEPVFYCGATSEQVNRCIQLSRRGKLFLLNRQYKNAISDFNDSLALQPFGFVYDLRAKGRARGWKEAGSRSRYAQSRGAAL